MKSNPFRRRIAALRLGPSLLGAALILWAGSAAGAEKFYLQAAEGGGRYGPFEFQNGAPVALGDKSFVIEKEVPPNDVAMEQRLKSIVLPDVTLRNARLEDVIRLLQQRSLELDPVSPQKGVNFVLKNGASETAALITLNLRRATLLDTLKMVTEVAGLKYRFDGEIVVIESQ